MNGRILIVDDEEDIVASIKRTLRTIGCTEVRSTCDPLQVLSLYDDFQPDLMLLDLHMPHLDGLALMKQMGSRVARCGYFPVLVLTGDLTAESKQAALALGGERLSVEAVRPGRTPAARQEPAGNPLPVCATPVAE